jgi:hypothetical protein
MRVRAVSLLLPLVVLAACADASPGPGNGDDGVPHATGSGDLLVRVEMVGGFVPVEWNLRSLPTFSLFGDGTLITPGPQIEIYPPPALPAISSRPVDEEGVQAILREAIGATDDLPEDLGDMGSVAIADAPTTVITVRAGDVDRRVEVYALGELTERPQGMPGEVYQARRELARLVERLMAPDAWLPEGSLGDEELHEGDEARLFVGPYRRVEDLPQEPAAWPLDASLGSFGAAGGSGGYRCGTVTGEDWRTVRGSATRANELTPWTDEGHRYSIVFRPLLPDETGCVGDQPAA